MVLNDTAEVQHALKQASYHSLLPLDSQPTRVKTRAWFIFESSWTKDQKGEELVKAAWSREVQGSRMFKVKQKLKWCKESFVRWMKRQKQNARKDIELILREMEHMQSQAEPRDWEK